MSLLRAYAYAFRKHLVELCGLEGKLLPRAAISH